MSGRNEIRVGPPDPVVEKVQSFLRWYWSDADTEEEVRAGLQASANLAPELIADGVAALRSVLADPGHRWRLTYLVEIDANHGLTEPGEAAARAFLERFAALVENVLTSDLPDLGGPTG